MAHRGWDGVDAYWGVEVVMVFYDVYFFCNLFLKFDHSSFLCSSCHHYNMYVVTVAWTQVDSVSTKHSAYTPSSS